jgi:hypothetical protein
VALKDAYDRDPIIREFLAEGGTQEEVEEAVKQHPTGTDGLRAALHRTRRGTLSARSEAAFARMEVLNDARVAMGFPAQPARVQQMRTALLAADRDVEIEAELTANWRADLWMPNSMRRWADIHTHYNGTQALQANVRFVHLKFDRTIPGAGPSITGHPLIAAAYADGRLDPSWQVDA